MHSHGFRNCTLMSGPPEMGKRKEGRVCVKPSKTWGGKKVGGERETKEYEGGKGVSPKTAKSSKFVCVRWVHAWLGRHANEEAKGRKCF